ncbi:MAG: ABC transporter permease [Lachnospiraceae bacterium]|nr:ABC transporter permease [Lachnospiraceae bacterium]
MFFHVFKYALKCLIKTRETVFWTLVFPFALSTFMFLAFGNLYETTEKFHAVSVAVVQQKENPIFEPVLKEVSGEGALLAVTETSEQQADKLLEEDEVKGIITVGDTVTLKVKESGMEQTVLHVFLNQFLQFKKTISDVAVAHPEKMGETVKKLSEQVDCFVEKNNTEGNQDDTVNYFYAIFAMTCLFASFASCDRILKIQANATALGQRRSVAPTHKLKGVLADFAACELVQYVIVCLLFLYMRFVLKIDFGTKIPAILLLLFVGTSFGIMLGILVGSLPRPGEAGKIGILISVSMVLSVLSDLVVDGIKALIERNVPILNDINPAALISDSFYALNIYEGYERFLQNLCILGGMTVALAVICYFVVRRNRYASL